MRFKYFKGVKKCLAVVLIFALVFTALPDSLSGLLVVKAADPEITMKTTTYDFTTVDKTYRPSEGGMVSAFGIYYAKYVASGVSFDGTLRFRNGNVLYFPIKNDTSKVTISMTCNGEKPDRLVILGEDKSDTTYRVAMSTTGTSVTVEDITDYIKTIDGVKYIPLISNGDVKAKNIVIDEYNPINSVTVSGTITNASTNGVTKIKFKNLDNPSAPIIETDVDASGNYSAVLRRVAGNTNYVASITKTGYMIDDTAKANKFVLTGNAATTTQNFSVVTAPVAKLSGTVTGVPDSMLKSTLSVKLVPADTALDNVVLTLVKNGDGSYTYADTYLTPDMNYTVVLTNADDYEIVGTVNKAEGVYTDIALTATAKALKDVTGSFVVSDKKTANVTKITFTNINTKDYSYTFNASGNTYSVKLRAGEYETSIVCDGYTAYDHVSVTDTAVTNDVYLQAPVDASKVPYEAEVKVGVGEKFETIASAVANISRMERGENDRVTILLLDSLYREQVIIDTPNITINSVRTGGSTITWYYGVGYSYYSAKIASDGKNGSYYDEACAVDKYYKAAVEQNPGHWGATVNLFAGAKGFMSENITFENSLNRYMTTEEVADGVTTNVNSAMIDRSKATDADVLTKANKERAAVIYNQADDTEYKDCKFLSSQDTIYTGDNNENSYFTNCLIEGTTDYICGDGNPVFDACTLSMYSYSDQEATGSYIAASKEKGVHGYLFKNCKIVTTSFPGLKATSGNILARAWGPGIVTFLNTEVESATMISPVAYADMNAKVTAAHYFEYNTHTPDGVAVDTTKRAAGVTILTDAQAADVSLTSYFDDFRPKFYYADYTAVNSILSKVNLLINSDYTDFSAVTAAVAAVVFDLDVTQQSKVDGMATNILNAVNALVKTPESNEPTTTSGDTTAAGGTSTQTGDTTPITMYALIMGISACTVMYITRRKKVRKA